MKLLAWLAILLGIIFVIVGIIYFITPAHSLPSFFPGFDASTAKTHLKHGIGAIGLALACFAFAWFNTGKKSSQK